MPLTILLFGARYLHRHDWIGTSFHVLVLVVSIGAGIILYKIAIATLGGQRKNLAPWKDALATRTTYTRVAWLLALGVIFCTLSFGAIEGVPPDFETTGEGGSLINAELSAWDARQWVPKLFRAVGYNSFADLREADVSSRLPNWKGQEEDEINAVKRGRLPAANIRFADATRAFLVGADLARANLQGVYLYHANLRRADLAWADLKESFVYEADIQNANLQHADLRGADFTRSNLGGANLRGARLEGTNLEEANLSKADLSGTSLSGAKGLTAKQIQEMIKDSQTVLPENLPEANKSEAKESGGK